MQALGQRVGWHSGMTGAEAPTAELARQSAVEGSKKQSASRPGWSVRAVLASRTRRRARSVIIAGDGPSVSAAASSARPTLPAAGPESRAPPRHASK